MINLSLREAQLMRLLAALFGSDRIVPWMKVATVCGEDWQLDGLDLGVELNSWAASNRCLFTIVDENDQPKMVVEIAADRPDAIDVAGLEHARILSAMCEAKGIIFITFSEREIEESALSSSSSEFRSFLEAKIEDRAE